mmetsp:Transcript_105219/g.241187  ORF Transcript_105219/g.241187 Transcript_105219/m.241187 type:complete len:236 (+) Transcript_105219:931-1638(+)
MAPCRGHGLRWGVDLLTLVFSSCCLACPGLLPIHLGGQNIHGSHVREFAPDAGVGVLRRHPDDSALVPDLQGLRATGVSNAAHHPVTDAIAPGQQLVLRPRSRAARSTWRRTLLPRWRRRRTGYPHGRPRGRAAGGGRNRRTQRTCPLLTPRRVAVLASGSKIRHRITRPLWHTLAKSLARFSHVALALALHPPIIHHRWWEPHSSRRAPRTSHARHGGNGRTRRPPALRWIHSW